MTTRRFPAPWRAEKMPGGYVVRENRSLTACLPGRVSGSFYLPAAGTSALAAHGLRAL
jgi:hypothetical protein